MKLSKVDRLLAGALPHCRCDTQLVHHPAAMFPAHKSACPAALAAATGQLTSCGHQHKAVAPAQRRLHNVALPGAEGGVAKHLRG